MNKQNKNFFKQNYKKQSEKCNSNKEVEIPANDPKNGIPLINKIDILFINERPGPIALKETSFISFDNPDSSAWFFKYLFEKTFGLKYRKKIFITNTIIWYPKLKNKNYKNKKPTTQEIKCGLPILEDQIKKVNPKIIVPLGITAMRALKYIYKNKKKLKTFKLTRDIRTIIKGEPIIYPVFHTALQGRINRYEGEQLKDWEKLKILMKREGIL